ncbi:unnamed protein product [Protopolystoma xenopodis]|uniref:Uncharacterized protein n=1 Tax=Protopolystoma xenopodis TaxID=117903 RepID=A0A448WBZ9_9PLAT|nr:unnamed protein product [Protopolystoma xenopodis]
MEDDDDDSNDLNNNCRNNRKSPVSSKGGREGEDDEEEEEIFVDVEDVNSSSAIEISLKRETLRPNAPCSSPKHSSTASNFVTGTGGTTLAVSMSSGSHSTSPISLINSASSTPGGAMPGKLPPPHPPSLNPGPDDIPIDTLCRHPDSARSRILGSNFDSALSSSTTALGTSSASSIVSAASSVGVSDGWQATLPSDWISVVAGDMASMSSATTRFGVELAGATSDGRAPIRPKPPTSGSGLTRFSDAYILGMPAKRRKVMIEHRLSLVQTPERIFADCLTSAIQQHSEPGFADRRGFSDSLTNGTSPNNGLLPTITVATGAGHLSSLPSADTELTAALGHFVSDQLAARLSRDPDFVPAQFPTADAFFLKRQNQTRQHDQTQQQQSIIASSSASEMSATPYVISTPDRPSGPYESSSRLV